MIKSRTDKMCGFHDDLLLLLNRSLSMFLLLFACASQKFQIKQQFRVYNE